MANRFLIFILKLNCSCNITPAKIVLIVLVQSSTLYFFVVFLDICVESRAGTPLPIWKSAYGEGTFRVWFLAKGWEGMNLIHGFAMYKYEVPSMFYSNEHYGLKVSIHCRWIGRENLLPYLTFTLLDFI